MTLSNDKQAVVPRQIERLKHFKRLVPLFQRLREVGCERDKAGNHKLFMDGYGLSVMLYLFNPLIDSIAMLAAAVRVPRVAKTLGLQPFSKKSFCESVRVFDPQAMNSIMVELARELTPLGKDPRLSQL